MNGNGMQINRRKCSKTTFLMPVGHYPDGTQALLASFCGQDGGMLHQCPHAPFSPSSWLPLVLAGIKITCPNAMLCTIWA